MSRFRFMVVLFAIANVLFCQSAVNGGKVEFSHKRGIYTDKFELQLSSKSQTTIYYTIDGSIPTATSSQKYQHPISIQETTVVRAATFSRNDNSNRTATHTFLFPAQVWRQPARPPGYIRSTISVRHGPSRPQTSDWAMDSELLTTKTERDALLNGLNDLPSLAVSQKVSDFNYLYNNHRSRGAAFERPASIELIYPNRKKYEFFQGFQIDCGLRMQGGLAIDQARKKSFRVLFKKKYGAGKLEYPIFESAAHHAGTEARRYDTLVLRGGGNGNWSKDIAWKHEPGMYLRDTLVRDSQIAMSGIGSRSTFVHLYINGLYFGVYNIAERPECKFMAAYYGGKPEDYVSINHNGAVDGDSTRWNQALRSSNIRQHLDIDLFCDYIILNWAVGMGDWPWNNFYAGMSTGPPGLIRFFAWDAEHAFWTNPGYLYSNPGGWVNPLFLDSAPNNLRSHSPILDIWHALKNDEDFRVDFADRVARHCLGVGELSDAKLLARFRRLENQLDKAIIAESCRWGDSAWGREDNPHTREKDYRVNCQKVAKLIEGNSARFVSALRDEGYYPDIKPPVLATPIPMGAVPLGINMRWKVPKNSSEQVYYTLDGSDPRLAGGHRNPEAKQWLADAAAIEITAATQVTARAFTQGKWSPRFRRTFFVEPQGFPLRITELMYHPSPDKSDESLEFVELQNISNVSIQLGGFHFTGIEYLFPPDAKLMPKQVVVLIPNDDPERFRDQYPGVQVLGLYRKNLSNGGERIAIQDANEQVISELTYQTSGDWPNSAGGTGMSIHLLDTLGDQSDPRNWRAGDSSPGKQG